ncbi:MAG: ribosome biogenesis GTPase Der [Bacteroidales bacterium]|nr:ribosome biogenesis GTPase Der [Bacteroidales bacterium]
MPNIVAIVGRPNVGKSTLFNRLTRTRTAIVEEVSGVTRDRIYGKSDWNGREFSVIDTGGYVAGSDDIFEEEIRKQVELAVHEADVILFIVDATEGISALDRDVAGYLRKSDKPVYLVANKIDTPNKSDAINEFYELGFEWIFPVSAANGSGTGDLLDKVVDHFHPDEFEDLPDIPRIAIVGRPNVGKSSLLNTLTGIERSIVSPIPGTTRDTVHTHYKGFGFDFLLIDTAGLRKKQKVQNNIEFYSVLRSIRAIETSDVCILMIDATQGFEAQDLNIFSLMQKNHKGVVLVVNKWDLIEKENNTHKVFEEAIREKISPSSDVPVVFTSVPQKQRILKILETSAIVYENRKRKISTSKLNEVFLPLIRDFPPPMSKGKQIKVKYVTQIKVDFPAFAFFCNLPQYIKDPYKRFIINKIREMFDFTGVPIEVFFRQK